MSKVKLAICMKDLEYQERFVNCFMNHYNRQYELHVFTNQHQLREVTNMEYAVIITEEYTTDEMADFVEKGEVILNLTENTAKQQVISGTNLVNTEKYQEIYKIAEVIESLTVEKMSMGSRYINVTENTCIGLYSLTQEMYQAPFAALLAKIHGAYHKTIVLDLQNYSGLGEIEEGMASMGLEDMLSVVHTGNYSRSRILEGIHHEAEWDYIGPTQNSQCLAEGSQELYAKLIKLLIQELGYQKIIINFGSVFLGQLDMMAECEVLYLLCGKDVDGHWRENRFFYELSRHGKENLLQKIKKVEIPKSSGREGSWNALAEKWSWDPLGELLRQTSREGENPWSSYVNPFAVGC